jgi:Rrf2 family transcriptional regulator, iron-sulfur cluster assembly transcription factor
MKISAMQEYGLRCILQVAVHGSETPLTVRDIARKEGLTSVYVAKILVTLRRSGLVRSVRGVRGGYVLSRPAKSISVAETLAALGRMDIVKNHCQRFPGVRDECIHIGNCGIRPVFALLAQQIYGFLNGLNLDQLAQEESAVARDIHQAGGRFPIQVMTAQP